jgi:hypothetical protein
MHACRKDTSSHPLEPRESAPAQRCPLLDLARRATAEAARALAIDRAVAAIMTLSELSDMMFSKNRLGIKAKESRQNNLTKF